MAKTKDKYDLDCSMFKGLVRKKLIDKTYISNGVIAIDRRLINSITFDITLQPYNIKEALHPYLDRVDFKDKKTQWIDTGIILKIRDKDLLPMPTKVYTNQTKTLFFGVDLRFYKEIVEDNTWFRLMNYWNTSQDHMAIARRKIDGKYAYIFLMGVEFNPEEEKKIRRKLGLKD